MYEELRKKNKDSLTMVLQVREYLEKEGYAPLDEWGGRAKLSYMLLLLLHSMPPSILPKGIRAVVMLLECEENTCSADAIATAVLCKIDPVLESMGQAADQTKGSASDARKVADRLYRMGEETRDELQKGMEMAKDNIQRATEALKDEMTKLNEVTAKVPTGTGKVGGCQHDRAQGGATYADVLNRQLPVAHLSTLARGRVKDRQVLIDKDPAAESNQLAGLNERELVAKANEAITHMVTKLQQGPLELRAVGAKKLNNGGIVSKVDKSELASWIRKEKNAFTAGFGGTAMVRDRATSVIIEFIPVEHSPDTLA